MIRRMSAKPPALKTRKPTGVPPLPFVVLAGVGKSGKAQPLDALVMTPAGPVPMGNIAVGDTVIHPSGGTSTVLAIHPQGVVPIYRLTFNDGATTRCCGDHLWLTRTATDRQKGRLGSVKSTTEIASTLMYRGREWNHAIPMAEPFDNGKDDVPVDPWLLGVLLGDGALTAGGVRLSIFEDDIRQRVAVTVSEIGHQLRAHARPGSFSICWPGSGNPLRSTLERLGVAGSLSTDKRIPEAYLHAGRKVREALLQGLIDTDGHVSGSQIEYSTSSPAMAHDVRRLVESLGGTAQTTRRSASYTTPGQRHEAADSYRVMVKVAPDVTPFSSAKHAARWEGNSRQHRTIRAVEPIGQAEAQCITVSSPDGLYVTDHHIVTHNSYSAAALTCDDRVGNVYWLDLGEGAADEYAALPGARYDVIEHDGTYDDIAGQIRAVVAQPRDELGRPNVLVIDTLSGLWTMLSDMADAAARASNKGKQLLKNDPAAEVPITMDKWNQAKARWRRVIDPLLAWQDGIVVALARADEVALVENGVPVVDKYKQPIRVWKLQGEKSLSNDATVVIKCVEPGYAEVVGARTLRFDKPVSPERPYCMENFKLGDLLFDVLGISAESTGRQIVALSTDAPDDEPAAPAQRGRSAQRPAAEEPETLCDIVATEAVAIKELSEQGDEQAAQGVAAIRQFLNGRKFADLTDPQLRQLQRIMAEHTAPFTGADETPAADEGDTAEPSAGGDEPADAAADSGAGDDEPTVGPGDDTEFTGGDIDAWVSWAGEWGFEEDEFMDIFTGRCGVRDVGDVASLTDAQVADIRAVFDVIWRQPVADSAEDAA